jgi:hypothetical protein
MADSHDIDGALPLALLFANTLPLPQNDHLSQPVNQTFQM